MGKTDFKPLFIKSESHNIFKQMAAKKNKKMSELFDDMFISDTDIGLNFNLFINTKPKKRKRGNVFLDTLLVFVVLIGIILGYIYLSDVNDDVKDIIDSDDDLSNFSKNLSAKQFDDYQSNTDTWILFLFGFLWISVIASSFLIEANPVFFIISLVLVISFLGAVVFVSNAMEEVLINDQAAILPQYPSAVFITQHLLEIIIVTSGIIFIILFGKRVILGG